MSDFTAPDRESRKWLRPVCWVKGHKWAAMKGGKPGSWVAKWRECVRCALIRDYHYV